MAAEACHFCVTEDLHLLFAVKDDILSSRENILGREEEVMALAERLKYARERANLSGQQVQERVGIGASSLSEFENGKREPKLSQLQCLATLYRRSISFLLAEGPIPREVVLWRKKPDDTADIEGRFLRLCEQYRNLEVWCGEPVDGFLPQVSGHPDDFGYPQAADLARRVRGEMALGDQPAHELLRVLEDVCAIKIFHRDFEPTGTAASTKSESFGMAILLNRGNARWRRNHDVAHELFHLLTWDVFRKEDDESSSVAGEREEQLATCFAGNLLMPAEAVTSALNRRAEGGKIGYEALYDVARQFDVSVESLLWRVHILQNRGSERMEQTRREIETAKTYALALEDRQRGETPPSLPERYRALAVKALWRGEMSVGRFAEYLEISRQEAARYAEQEVADSEKVPLAPA